MLKITSIFKTESEWSDGLMFSKPLIGDEAVVFISPKNRSQGF